MDRMKWGQHSWLRGQPGQRHGMLRGLSGQAKLPPATCPPLGHSRHEDAILSPGWSLGMGFLKWKYLHTDSGYLGLYRCSLGSGTSLSISQPLSPHLYNERGGRE